MSSVIKLRKWYSDGARAKDLARFVRFGLVGLTGVGVSIGTLKLLTDGIGLYYIVSAAFAHILAVTNNFTWNRIWTFGDRPKQVRFSGVAGQWLRFLLSSSVALAVNLGVLTLLTEVFHIYYILSALCAIAVATPLNFLAGNFWVWRAPQQKASGGDKGSR